MKLAIIGSRTFTDYAALDLAIKQFFCDATTDGYIPRTLDQYEATAQRRYSAANEFSRRVNIEREAEQTAAEILRIDTERLRGESGGWLGDWVVGGLFWFADGWSGGWRSDGYLHCLH